jgi:hypothetical protein
MVFDTVFDTVFDMVFDMVSVDPESVHCAPSGFGTHM